MSHSLRCPEKVFFYKSGIASIKTENKKKRIEKSSLNQIKEDEEGEIQEVRANPFANMFGNFEDKLSKNQKSDNILIEGNDIEILLNSKHIKEKNKTKKAAEAIIDIEKLISDESEKISLEEEKELNEQEEENLGELKRVFTQHKKLIKKTGLKEKVVTLEDKEFLNRAEQTTKKIDAINSIAKRQYKLEKKYNTRKLDDMTSKEKKKLRQIRKKFQSLETPKWPLNESFWFNPLKPWVIIFKFRKFLLRQLENILEKKLLCTSNF